MQNHWHFPIAVMYLNQIYAHITSKHPTFFSRLANKATDVAQLSPAYNYTLFYFNSRSKAYPYTYIRHDVINPNMVAMHILAALQYINMRVNSYTLEQLAALFGGASDPMVLERLKNQLNSPDAHGETSQLTKKQLYFFIMQLAFALELDAACYPIISAVAKNTNLYLVLPSDWQNLCRTQEIQRNNDGSVLISPPIRAAIVRWQLLYLDAIDYNRGALAKRLCELLPVAITPGRIVEMVDTWTTEACQTVESVLTSNTRLLTNLETQIKERHRQSHEPIVEFIATLEKILLVPEIDPKIQHTLQSMSSLLGAINRVDKTSWHYRLICSALSGLKHITSKTLPLLFIKNPDAFSEPLDILLKKTEGLKQCLEELCKSLASFLRCLNLIRDDKTTLQELLYFLSKTKTDCDMMATPIPITTLYNSEVNAVDAPPKRQSPTPPCAAPKRISSANNG